jgi:cell wall assembly regulator SMI1
MSVRATWERLRAELAVDAPQLLERLRAPLPSALAKPELPADYRAWLLLHDGMEQGSEPCGWFFGQELAPLGQAERTLAYLEEWGWKPHRWPITYGRDGDVIYLMLRRTQRHPQGAVMHWSHDGDEHSQLAESFEQALALLAQGLEQGDLRLAAGDWGVVNAEELDGVLPAAVATATALGIEENYAQEILDTLGMGLAEARPSEEPLAYGDELIVTGGPTPSLRCTRPHAWLSEDSMHSGAAARADWWVGAGRALRIEPLHTQQALEAASRYALRAIQAGREVTLPGLGVVGVEHGALSFEPDPRLGRSAPEVQDAVSGDDTALVSFLAKESGVDKEAMVQALREALQSQAERAGLSTPTVTWTGKAFTLRDASGQLQGIERFLDAACDEAMAALASVP